MNKVKWLVAPEDQDFSAALSYLELICDSASAKKLVDQFSQEEVSEIKAKDVIRAAQLSLLSEENVHVAKDLKKIKGGKPLSPILLVRGDAAKSIPLVIADGYHRACAVYWFDEDAYINVKIVDWK